MLYSFCKKNPNLTPVLPLLPPEKENLTKYDLKIKSAAVISSFRIRIRKCGSGSVTLDLILAKTPSLLFSGVSLQNPISNSNPPPSNNLAGIFFFISTDQTTFGNRERERKKESVCVNEEKKYIIEI